jgi:hypothetical protein
LHRLPHDADQIFRERVEVRLVAQSGERDFPAALLSVSVEGLLPGSGYLR